jgi:hypothetical protein
MRRIRRVYRRQAFPVPVLEAVEFAPDSPPAVGTPVEVDHVDAT